ncbi:hypothetical protein H0B56_21075 [Haloechinothrix sp. YIM 98757]|uniref:Excreted virulence factor EspC, type VII ESX diderm n=1 Tax=Haloechinothrix aidingensis TaxID=2752311 RepID=A0A838AFD9_9PSEU|nr:hypothetical protein [Haloechinothrix aidingensis]MBA0128046.1 hypothetical protein [Haloechinothrix aidingensis]
MSEGFFAEADRIAARSGDFEVYAERTRAIARSLESRLRATGAAWGSDEIGTRFAAAHVERADRAFERIAWLEHELREVGTRFADAAAGYRSVERDARDRIDDVSGRLEG